MGSNQRYLGISPHIFERNTNTSIRYLSPINDSPDVQQTYAERMNITPLSLRQSYHTSCITSKRDNYFHSKCNNRKVDDNSTGTINPFLINL